MLTLQYSLCNAHFAILTLQCSLCNTQAFDNKLKIGKKGSAWASRGEGVGAWILATFSRPVEVVKLKVAVSNFSAQVYFVNFSQILQRHSPVEANKQVSLETSSGWSQTAGLPAKVTKSLCNYIYI